MSRSNNSSINDTKYSFYTDCDLKGKSITNFENDLRSYKPLSKGARTPPKIILRHDPMVEKLEQWKREKELKTMSPVINKKKESKQTSSRPFENSLRSYENISWSSQQKKMKSSRETRSICSSSQRSSLMEKNFANSSVQFTPSDFLNTIEDRIEDIYHNFVKGRIKDRQLIRKEIIDILQQCEIKIIKGLMVGGLESVKHNQQLWYTFLLNFDFKQIWKDNAFRFLRENNIMQQQHLEFVERNVRILPDDNHKQQHQQSSHSQINSQKIQADSYLSCQNQNELYPIKEEGRENGNQQQRTDFSVIEEQQKYQILEERKQQEIELNDEERKSIQDDQQSYSIDKYQQEQEGCDQQRQQEEINKYQQEQSQKYEEWHKLFEQQANISNQIIQQEMEEDAKNNILLENKSNLFPKSSQNCYLELQKQTYAFQIDDTEEVHNFSKEEAGILDSSINHSSSQSQNRQSQQQQWQQQPQIFEKQLQEQDRISKAKNDNLTNEIQQSISQSQNNQQKQQFSYTYDKQIFDTNLQQEQDNEKSEILVSDISILDDKNSKQQQQIFDTLLQEEQEEDHPSNNKTGFLTNEIEQSISENQNHELQQQQSSEIEILDAQLHKEQQLMENINILNEREQSISSLNNRKQYSSQVQKTDEQEIEQQDQPSKENSDLLFGQSLKGQQKSLPPFLWMNAEVAEEQLVRVVVSEGNKNTQKQAVKDEQFPFNNKYENQSINVINSVDEHKKSPIIKNNYTSSITRNLYFPINKEQNQSLFSCNDEDNQNSLRQSQRFLEGQQRQGENIFQQEKKEENHQISSCNELSAERKAQINKMIQTFGNMFPSQRGEDKQNSISIFKSNDFDKKDMINKKENNINNDDEYEEKQQKDNDILKQIGSTDDSLYICNRASNNQQTVVLQKQQNSQQSNPSITSEKHSCNNDVEKIEETSDFSKYFKVNDLIEQPSYGLSENIFTNCKVQIEEKQENKDLNKNKEIKYYCTNEDNEAAKAKQDSIEQNQIQDTQPKHIEMIEVITESKQRKKLSEKKEILIEGDEDIQPFEQQNRILKQQLFQSHPSLDEKAMKNPIIQKFLSSFVLRNREFIVEGIENQAQNEQQQQQLSCQKSTGDKRVVSDDNMIPIKLNLNSKENVYLQENTPKIAEISEAINENISNNPEYSFNFQNATSNCQSTKVSIQENTANFSNHSFEQKNKTDIPNNEQAFQSQNSSLKNSRKSKQQTPVKERNEINQGQSSKSFKKRKSILGLDISQIENSEIYHLGSSYIFTLEASNHKQNKHSKKKEDNLTPQNMKLNFEDNEQEIQQLIPHWTRRSFRILNKSKQAYQGDDTQFKGEQPMMTPEKYFEEQQQQNDKSDKKQIY